MSDTKNEKSKTESKIRQKINVLKITEIHFRPWFSVLIK